MDADGSNQTRLTDNPEPDWQPAWSPDGTRIAFASARDGIYQIYIMNAGGSNQTRVIYGLRTEQAHPSWSPYNGGEIAFAADYYGNWEICVVGALHGIETRLHHPASDLNPTWSPDGSKIAFATNRDRNREVYVMNADGSNQVNLTNNQANDDEPAWLTGGLATLPSITVISPNGGENWTAGTTQTIQWRYTGNPGAYVEISLLKSEFLRLTIIGSTPIGAAGSGSYSWTIPPEQTPGTDYKIRIDSTPARLYADTSDGNFSIGVGVPSTPSAVLGELTIDPVYERNPVATQITIVITVLDTNGKPMPRVRLSISHTGAHTFAPIQLSTDASGRAHYSYTGTKAGTDTIVVTADSLSAKATREWFIVAKLGKITLAPVTASRRLGTTHDITATVLGTDGKPMSGILVTFNVSGTTSLSRQVTTDKDGQATLSYTSQKEGKDIIKATADSLAAMATIQWQFDSAVGGQ
jgi:hypothetical protein